MTGPAPAPLDGRDVGWREDFANRIGSQVHSMSKAGPITGSTARRPGPGDSSPTDALEERRDHYRGADRAGVRSRAQQDSLWNRQQLSNQLRSLLREYYPAALAAFEPWRNGLCRPEAQELLKAAPTPTRAARLTRTQLEAALKRTGRKRGITAEAERLRDVFRRDYLHHAPQVEAAFGQQTAALLRQLDTACANAEQLEAATSEAFDQHPDAHVITSFPGLGSLTGARVLAEIGDDRSRFANAGSLKAYAGSAPLTRASGKSCVVTSRRVKNQRLASTGNTWAFASLRGSTEARAHYDRRREAGDRHVAALRNLFNRFLGMLFFCLHHGVPYDPVKAFPNRPTPEILSAVA